MKIFSARPWLLVAAFLCCLCHGVCAQSRLAIVGGTLLDVSHFGQSHNDLTNQVILVEDGRITAVGPADEVKVPAGFQVLDARGRFVMPGLVDGFAVLNNQAYAQAYLAMGVTSIVGVGGGRRGEMFFDADPGPAIYPLEDVGYEPRSEDELLERLEELAAGNVKVALLMYRLTPKKLRIVARRARELGLVTIGELALSDYRDGINCGLNAFVHTTRYSLGMAGAEHVKGIAREPFSDDLESPKWRYYRWLSQVKAGDPALASWSRRLARGSTFLIPTAGLLSLFQPGAPNPWKFPAAALLDPADINKPAGRDGSSPDWTDAQLEAYRALARASEVIETSHVKAGCRYLAGSGTDVWGTMPGISLFLELKAFVRWGMTPRQALAAATSNFAAAYHWNELGAIRPGCRADILVLDRNPTENIDHLQSLHRVVAAGSVLDPRTLLKPPGSDKGRILSRQAWNRPEKYRGKKYAFLDKVEIENITYGSQCLQVKGVLARPRGTGPWPCIIYLRGGNREFGRINDRRIAGVLGRMASWGYVVVATQYRGVAGGTGVEEFGGREIHDVLNLIPLLDSLPEADGKRLGVRAGSRGGMMAWLLMRESSRVKACVIRAGLSDLVAWRRERPEMESVFRELIPSYDRLGDAALKARSVVNWIDKLKSQAPVLLLQGTGDWRIKPGNALKLGQALEKARIPFRLVMLEGSDHSLSEHRREAWELTRSWFDRFVRDGHPAPSLEPHGQ